MDITNEDGSGIPFEYPGITENLHVLKLASAVDEPEDWQYQRLEAIHCLLCWAHDAYLMAVKYDGDRVVDTYAVQGRGDERLRFLARELGCRCFTN